jgi:hypothetical protein
MGHLFVMHGDLHRLDCDGWLLPTDLRLTIEPWAEPAFADVPAPRPADAPRDWHGRTRTFRWDRGAAPPVWLTDVGADRAMPLTWYLEGVRAFVEDASESLARDPAATGPTARGRSRPLLGLPIVATGEGGMRERPDRLLLDLLPELRRLADSAEVDLVLVTPDRLKYDAAQAARRQLGGHDARLGPELAPEALATTAGLAARVRAQQVGLFVGAGISIGAGLPGWQDLLVRVAERLDDTRLAEELCQVLDERRLDPLDVATLLSNRLRDSAGEDVLRATVAAIAAGTHRHALAHGLLASLGVGRAVTTNYDRLFETAADGARRPVAVLPYERPAADEPWLLKLHGDVDHPADIVLTRQDFLRYTSDRNALTGVVHALLLTQHLLFVGYSLSDPTFHRVIDEVRQALSRAGGEGVFGTVLVAEPPSPAVRELWGRDLDVVVAGRGAGREDFRSHDLWLDTLAMHASDPDAHLLSPRFEGLLDARQRAVRDALQPVVDRFAGDGLTGTAADRVRDLLEALGLTHD